MKKKKLLFNTVSSIIFQVTTIVCGFVLPRLILHSYGSEVNGLINSITQFLQVITFLELGVGSVMQSSLYKPLFDKDNEQISKVIASAAKFFKRLARILFVYIIILIIAYPFIANQNFGFLYTALLIAAMSISSFAQYYFGMVDRLLLTADQKGYISYTVQTVTLIANTVACAVLIKVGASIHLVKLTTSIIYLIRPLVLRLYINKHYQINRKISYKGEPIKQKWNGVAQHVAAIVLDGTDNIVLTVFSTLTDVSVYSVYHLVVFGVKQFFHASVNGFQSLLGEYWAEKNQKKLNGLFSLVEWAIHTAAVLVWGCTFILIVPFVRVYTKGIEDANYIVPLFAALITLANAAHSLRLPYHIMILAAGHYKQTQRCYIISAAANIIISVILVIKFGLIGVAIGTLVGMTYQTIWMAVYDTKHLLKRPMSSFIKQLVIDCITFAAGCLATYSIELGSVTYFAWIIQAIKVALIWGAIVLLVNIIFYCGNFKRVVELIGKKRKRNT